MNTVNLCLVTLTVRWPDSNSWRTVIKQSYLYKNRVNLHFIIVIKLVWLVCVCVYVLWPGT